MSLRAQGFTWKMLVVPGMADVQSPLVVDLLAVGSIDPDARAPVTQVLSCLPSHTRTRSDFATELYFSVVLELIGVRFCALTLLVVVIVIEC